MGMVSLLLLTLRSKTFLNQTHNPTNYWMYLIKEMFIDNLNKRASAQLRV